MILTNCNCPVKIDCGCGTLSFDYFNDAATSVLEVGELVSDGEGCVLEGYVIDWYVNGVKVLTTGVGNDPDIQGIHPFTGDAAIPVEGGSYVPVLRYLVIDGERVFTIPKNCQKWCDVMINLPESIVVSRLNCGVNNITGSYQYRVTYSSREPDSLPARRIAWDLPGDKSVKYFAVVFYAYEIADKIEVFFNDESNSLAAWITATTVITDYYSVPAVYRASAVFPLKFVIELPEYQESDFLIVKITPSVLQPDVKETDWRVEFKCLETFPGCDFINIDQRAVDVKAYEWRDNTAGCQYEILVPFVNNVPRISLSSSPYFPVRIYNGLQSSGMNSAVWTAITNPPVFTKIGVRFPYSKWPVSQSSGDSGYSTRYASQGIVTLQKNGNVFTWTFESEADYLDVYDRYTASKDGLWYTNFEDDDSDVRYYRWWYWVWKERPANCGDNASSVTRQLYFHRKSTILFDDSGGVYTLTINAVSVTNEYSSEPCNSLVNQINSLIQSANNTINASDYSENSLCFEYKMFGYRFGYTGSTYSFQKIRHGGLMIRIFGNNIPCYNDWDNAGIIYKLGSTIQYFYHAYFICEFDLELDSETGDFPRDEFGEYTREPFENFSFYDGINPSTQGGLSTKSEDRLLLRVVDGIIVFPEP